MRALVLCALVVFLWPDIDTVVFELRVGTMCVCEQVGSHVSVEGSEAKQARQRVSTLPY